MNMLDIHLEALENKVGCYHEFLSRYSKTNTIVYGFVEGKEDPSFYKGFIENSIPDGWTAELWAAGNKKQVYRIFTDLDWRRFPKKRICFFVDRDLSDLIPDNVGKDINIYITDGYSIENDIVSGATFQRVLTEVCGYGSIPHDEIDTVCDLFEQQLDIFLESMVVVMAWILLWRRSTIRAGLNDIQMKDIFDVIAGQLVVKNNPQGKANVIEYIHGQCNVAYDPTQDIHDLEVLFRDDGLYKKFVRGKYVLWFLIEFCNCVRATATKLFNSCHTNPPMHISLSSSNAAIVIGNRSRIPVTLRAFLLDNYCAYISSVAA